MNAWTFRGLAAAVLMLASLPAAAQNVRYESQGAAYVANEDALIAERVVDGVIGADTGAAAQVVFFRTGDGRPGELGLSGDAGFLAQLPAKAYYAIAVDPGSHDYAVEGDTLSLQMSPGERRYVRIDDNARLVPSNALTFLRLVTGKREPLYARN